MHANLTARNELVSYLGFRAHQLNKAIWCPDVKQSADGSWYQSSYSWLDYHTGIGCLSCLLSFI